MSALSYLLSRVELVVKAPPVPSSFTGTFLVSSGAGLDLLLLPVELSGTSSTGTQHSEEARLLEWVQEPLPELGVLPMAEALSVFFSVARARNQRGPRQKPRRCPSRRMAGVEFLHKLHP